MNHEYFLRSNHLREKVEQLLKIFNFHFIIKDNYVPKRVIKLSLMFVFGRVHIRNNYTLFTNSATVECYTESGGRKTLL